MSIADITRNALTHEHIMLEASTGVLEHWAEDTAAWEHQNAPWQDHTGHARLGLSFVRLEVPEEQGAAVALVHGVSYGKKLEVDYGARFQIIQPAVAVRGPELVQDLKKVWH